MQSNGMNRIRKWGALTGSIVLLWLFMFVIAPWFMRYTAVSELAQYIDERDIEATALWWSEVEIGADAEMNCRNSVQYPPDSHK